LPIYAIIEDKKEKNGRDGKSISGSRYICFSRLRESVLNENISLL